MRAGPAVILIWPLLGACIRSVHGDGPSGPSVPGGEARLLEEQLGHGRLVTIGDRIVVDLIGRYAGGETWAEGPLTLIYGPGTYQGALHPVRVGARYLLQYRNDPNDTTSRLVPFPGLDPENEAYQVRRDRGRILVEHRIRRVCRPLKLLLLQTGFGAIETNLGCWPIPRFAPSTLGPVDPGIDAPPLDGKPVDEPVLPRASADTTAYLDSDGLHRAVREARPEIAGWRTCSSRARGTCTPPTAIARSATSPRVRTSFPPVSPRPT